MPSLDPHVVLDGLHARHPACDFDCLVDVRLRPDEAAQLDRTLERFDVDLVDLTAGSLKIAVFTFVVITESSTYSHEELTLRVELHLRPAVDRLPPQASRLRRPRWTRGPATHANERIPSLHHRVGPVREGRSTKSPCSITSHQCHVFPALRVAGTKGPDRAPFPERRSAEARCAMN